MNFKGKAATLRAVGMLFFLGGILPITVLHLGHSRELDFLSGFCFGMSIALNFWAVMLSRRSNCSPS